MENTRRSFLTTAAALGAAGFAASLAARSFGNSQAGASAAPGTPPGTAPVTPPVAPAATPGAMVVGSGSARFEVHHDWLVPPPGGAAFGDTHGAAQDSKGNVYIAHTVHPSSTLKDAVYVYSSDGKFIRSFGKEFAGGAHGLDLHAEDGAEFLYHCDTGRRMVVKTDLNGKVLWEAGCPMESGVYASADKWCPTNAAFGPDGTVFVGDGYGGSFVHAFSKDGKWKKIIARPGQDPGQVACPHGIYVDLRGTNFTREPALVVADRGNRRIQYLSLDGTHLGFVNNAMRQPCDMKVRGDRMLVPDLDSVVTILDSKNELIVQLCDGNPSSLRGASRDQFIPGKFVHPHDAIWLANGDILVAEWVPIGRVTLLRAVS